MKEITKWQCDKCGAEFEDENNCLEHEMHHHHNPVRYVANYGQQSIIPCSIKVEFENGHSELYYPSER